MLGRAGRLMFNPTGTRKLGDTIRQASPAQNKMILLPLFGNKLKLLIDLNCTFSFLMVVNVLYTPGKESIVFCKQLSLMRYIVLMECLGMRV